MSPQERSFEISSSDQQLNNIAYRFIANIFGTIKQQACHVNKLT